MQMDDILRARYETKLKHVAFNFFSTITSSFLYSRNQQIRLFYVHGMST